jgi:hypothetical protein
LIWRISRRHGTICLITVLIHSNDQTEKEYDFIGRVSSNALSTWTSVQSSTSILLKSIPQSDAYVQPATSDPQSKSSTQAASQTLQSAFQSTSTLLSYNLHSADNYSDINIQSAIVINYIHSEPYKQNFAAHEWRQSI